ncbi:MAG TPA: hypothetical protein VLX90_12335 [Steroidobacteraceae bacterium]|nr:hypothetical protein [Steroidobacteraceae bacterium]
MSTPESDLARRPAPAAATTPGGAPVAGSPAASGVSQGAALWHTLLMLVRRELWEHRALWMTPLLVAGLLVACSFAMHSVTIDIDGDPALQVTSGNRQALFALMQWGLTVPQYVVMAILLSFYLLDCLYAERRDRSILFWKSLPVSDAATVTSKLLVALLVVPLGVYLLAMLTNLLFSAIWFGRAAFGRPLPLTVSWDTVVWLKVQALTLAGLLISILWYAPFAAYLLLVSAWARRSVFVWATLPPVIAMLVERVALGTHYLRDFINYRTWGVWASLHLEDAVRRSVLGGSHKILSLPMLFDSIGFGGVLANIDLWLGLAVAGGLTFATVRIRRYRDDT